MSTALRRLFLLLTIAVAITPTTGQNNCKQQQQLFQLLEQHHVHSNELDDTWSKNVFDLATRAFNDYSIVLSKTDSSALEGYRTTLDDNFPATSCLFYRELAKRYQIATKEILSTLQNMPATSITFSEKETIRLCTNDTACYFINKAGRTNAVKKLIKAKTLNNFMLSEQLLNKNEGDIIALFNKQKDSLVLATIQHLKSHFNSPLESSSDTEIMAQEKYFNALCNVYDPHTAYFSAQAKDEFDILLSDEYYTFGLEIEKNEDGAIISRIIPGGSAWKSNEVHQGDRILQMTISNGETVIPQNYSLHELEAMLRSHEPLVASISLLTANGTRNVVQLTSMQSVNNDNIVKSFVLKGEHSIGYISLPGFYSDFNSPAMLGCANDVAKELIKLNKSAIDGILLDLRDNGGGSLKEAIDLAGIFIDAGAMVVVKDKNKKLTTLKDLNRGAIYRGPVVVLVNKASASASEIVAAIMQDHNRALIIGTQTFGKASGQEIMLTDSSSSEQNAIKITTSLLFRVDGTSYQNKGIEPDIEIPDPYRSFYTSESEMPHSLPAETIVKKTYYTPLAPIEKDNLRQQSSKRIENSKLFAEMQILQNELESERGKLTSSIPLDIETFVKKHIHLFAIKTKIDSLATTKSNAYSVSNNKFEQDLMQINSYQTAMQETLLNSIANDLILEEAFYITNDYITQLKQ